MSSEKISEKIAKQIHTYFSKTEYDLGMGQSLELAEKFIKDNEFSFSIEDGELVLNLSKDELMTWVKRQLANHQ
jgi:UTP-glucose-1-phosphate uridylyltransferase